MILIISTQARGISRVTMVVVYDVTNGLCVSGVREYLLFVLFRGGKILS